MCLPLSTKVTKWGQIRPISVSVDPDTSVGPRLQILLVDEFGGFQDAFRQADYRVSVVSLPLLLRWRHRLAVYLYEQRLEVFDIARLTETYVDRVPVSSPLRQPATALITGTLPTALRYDRRLLSTIKVADDRNAGVTWRWCVRVPIIGDPTCRRTSTGCNPLLIRSLTRLGQLRDEDLQIWLVLAVTIFPGTLRI